MSATAMAPDVMITTAPSLHLPDEPVGRRSQWWREVAAGRPFDDLLESDDGPAAWLWDRWAVLRRAGLGRKDFTTVVVGYRRELWLWLLGERRWAQTCSGLIGRVDRRLCERFVAATDSALTSGAPAAR